MKSPLPAAPRFHVLLFPNLWRLVLTAILLMAAVRGAEWEPTVVVLEYNEPRPYLTPIATLPGTQVGIPYYEEDGFISKPLGPISSTPPYDLSLKGEGRPPNNGTPIIQLLIRDTYEVFRLDGAPFDALSIDLAEYSPVYPVPQNIRFVGTKAEGGEVEVVFRIDGVVAFETFQFPDSFRDLINLRTTTDRFSLDNLKLEFLTPPLEIVDVSASPSVIWPPNRRMITVDLEALTEGGWGEATWAVQWVDCDEAVADGEIEIVDDHTVRLRAARHWRGDGRTYTIWLQAMDDAGHVSDFHPVEVTVPRYYRQRAADRYRFIGRMR